MDDLESGVRLGRTGLGPSDDLGGDQRRAVPRAEDDLAPRPQRGHEARRRDGRSAPGTILAPPGQGVSRGLRRHLHPEHRSGLLFRGAFPDAVADSLEARARSVERPRGGPDHRHPHLAQARPPPFRAVLGVADSPHRFDAVSASPSAAPTSVVIPLSLAAGGGQLCPLYIKPAHLSLMQRLSRRKVVRSSSTRSPKSVRVSASRHEASPART